MKNLSFFIVLIILLQIGFFTMTHAKDSSIEEMFSHIETVLGEIEKKILNSDQKLQDLEEQNQTIKVDIEQINYLKDFDLNVSDIGE